MAALLPLAGPVIGAIGTGIAASKAASAASKTDKANQQINLQNLAARNQERLDAIAQAEKMDAFLRETYGDQVADRAAQMQRMGEEREGYKGEAAAQREEDYSGYTDAMGNSTRYIPGQGWVTTKGEGTQEDRDRREREREDEDLFRAVRGEQIEDYRKGREFADLQSREVERQIREERPLVTEQLRSNFTQQGKERDQSNAFMEQLKGLREEDPIAFENLLRNRATQAINEGYDATTSDAMRTGLRTGASNTDRIVAEIGRSRGRDLQKAAVDSMIQARGVTRKEYQDERANLAGLYGAFAERAGKVPQMQQFQMQKAATPTLSIASRGDFGAEVDENARAAQTAIGARNLRTAFQATPFTPYTAPVNPNTSGQQALVTAFGSKGGTMDYQQPDNSEAMKWASFGNTASTLAGAFNNAMNKKPPAGTSNTGGYNPLEKAFSF